MHSSTHELLFRKSTYSGRGDNCVEVADAPGVSAVRDTQNRDEGHLEFPAAEWKALLGAAVRK